MEANKRFIQFVLFLALVFPMSTLSNYIPEAYVKGLGVGYMAASGASLLYGIGLGLEKARND